MKTFKGRSRHSSTCHFMIVLLCLVLLIMGVAHAEKNHNSNDINSTKTNKTSIRTGLNDSRSYDDETIKGSEKFIDKESDVNWLEINTGLNNLYIQALAIDASTPTIFYAGTNNRGIFKSTDGGHHWTEINRGLTNTNIEAIAIDPITPTTIYAGINGRGIFKSTNGGINWTEIKTGLTDLSVLALTIDPITPTTIYAGTSGSGVFKSTNGGINWTEMNTGLTDPSVLSLAIVATNPITIYAGTYGYGLFKSTDGGRHWIEMNTGIFNTNVWALAVNPIEPYAIYKGTGANGIFKSTDGGVNWSEMNTGLSDASIRFLAVDMACATLYAGTHNGKVFNSQLNLNERFKDEESFKSCSFKRNILTPAHDDEQSQQLHTFYSNHLTGSKISQYTFQDLNINYSLNDGIFVRKDFFELDVPILLFP